MTIDIRNQIESAAAWRALQMKKGRGKQRNIRVVTIAELHDNQSDAMKQHLIYDCQHRMLPRFKSAPRNTPKPWRGHFVAGVQDA